MTSKEPIDYGFDTAREIDAAIRSGSLPKCALILPDNKEHVVYKGFAAFYGVGSIEEPGVLDDEIRKRYRGVEVIVNPVQSVEDIPVHFGDRATEMLPGFYYTFRRGR